MGEFGRTPKINPQAGRDHFPAAWTTVLAEGGIKGGQVIGRLRPRRDGRPRTDPVPLPDFLATVCKGVGGRSHGPERFRDRPADPDRGSEGQGPSRRCWHDHTVPGLLVLVVAVGVRARARALRATSRTRTTIPDPSRPTSESGQDAVQDVMFLGDTRPIFIRLRLDAGGKAFRTAWLDSVKAIHAYLDRDGDGTLTREEADRGSLPTMVRATTGGAGGAFPAQDLDASPKDGKVSLEELADVLRPALGPFRVQVGRLAIDRNDALFNHLDRNKDGAVGKDELAHAVKSLRRFDLDEDELIDPAELDPFSNPIAAKNEDRANAAGGLRWSPSDRARPTTRRSVPCGSCSEVRQGERQGRGGRRQPLRAPRVRDRPRASPRPIPTGRCARFRGVTALLTRSAPSWNSWPSSPGELALRDDLAASGAGPGRCRRRSASRTLPRGPRNRHRRGQPRIPRRRRRARAENARRYYAGQFQAADTDNNKYLEKSELKDHGPFALLFDMMDKDGDGKLYMKEVDAFVDQQSQAARSQMVLSVDDQGRAIFAIVDLNRDRHLGIREIRDSVERVSTWDRNGDGLIRSDEIPHHYQLSIGRGQITAVGMTARAPVTMAATAPVEPAAGPPWFRKMDRNRDGDISRREFLGPRAAFERLDGDHDGLIDAGEAAKAK